MALVKEIEKENGVVLNYHRITSLNKITNQNNIIEVNSYINEKQREKEKEYQELQKEYAKVIEELENPDLTEEEREELELKEQKLQEELEKGINVLIDADYISTDYNAEMTIEVAYKYLKTTEKYKDAKDV